MKRVVIVGAGALGSHTALLLRNEAELMVVDHDHVEQKNVLSQFHSRVSLRKNKATALAGMIQLLYGISVAARGVKLTAINARELVGPAASLVVDAVDNAEGRRTCQAIARERGIPCMHGGLAAGGGYGMVRWDEDFVISDAPDGAPTCEDGEHLPFIARVASLMASAAQTYLRTGKRRGFAVAADSVQAL